MEPDRNNPGQIGGNGEPKEPGQGINSPRADDDGRSSDAPWKLKGLLPPLSDLEYEELKESIRRHKTVVPSIVDADGNVIDGEHRERACKNLGIDCPKVIQEFASEAEKILLAIKLNVTLPPSSQSPEPRKGNRT